MLQKNIISTVVMMSCAAIALTACVTKKKEKGSASLASCMAKMKAFDKPRGVCIEPDRDFCANQLRAIKGIGVCQAPSSQSDCNALGAVLGQSLSWSGSKCQGAVVDGGQTRPDNSINISWQGKNTVQGARTSFIEIGKAKVAISNNDHHQVNMLRKADSTCELRQTQLGQKTIKIEAKGTPSVCAGQILVINTMTGGYNVKNFSVNLQ